jgi:hypothetical protein
MTLFSNLGYITSYEGMISEEWNGKDLEGNGRGLMKNTIPSFVWRDWEKPWNTIFRIAGHRPEIWIRDLPNTKQDC